MYLIKSRPKKADVKTIEDALKKLLSANYKDKGFVIIEDFYEKKFVQLGLENYGLMLMWPNVKGQEENLIKVRKLFLNREYSESK